MRQNRCELMTKPILLQNFILSEISDESEHSKNVKAKFTIRANCPMQNYFSRQLTPKAKKEIQHSSQMKKFTCFPEANNKQTGGQENNFSG